MKNYQDADLDSVSIDLSPEERRLFAWGDLEGFNLVHEDEGESYKDSAPVTTICQRESDGSYWKYMWDKHTSHYGHGEHDYDVETNIRRVNKVEKVVTTTVVDWIRIKE